MLVLRLSQNLKRRLELLLGVMMLKQETSLRDLYRVKDLNSVIGMHLQKWKFPLNLRIFRVPKLTLIMVLRSLP